MDSVDELQVGDHRCGIYENEEEHRGLLSAFVRQGVERGEKMYYIVDAHTAAELRARLEADGVEVDALVETGQFSFLTVKDAYLRDGEFDPDKMIALLGEETRRALDEGYPALRVTGEITWALVGEPGSDRLVEYEAKLAVVIEPPLAKTSPAKQVETLQERRALEKPLLGGVTAAEASATACARSGTHRSPP